MNQDDFIKEPLEEETGTEIDNSVQIIPGTAPSFDSMSEEELNMKKKETTSQEKEDDEDTYRATSVNNLNHDNDQS